MSNRIGLPDVLRQSTFGLAWACKINHDNLLCISHGLKRPWPSGMAAISNGLASSFGRPDRRKYFLFFGLL